MPAAKRVPGDPTIAAQPWQFVNGIGDDRMTAIIAEKSPAFAILAGVLHGDAILAATAFPCRLTQYVVDAIRKAAAISFVQ